MALARPKSTPRKPDTRDRAIQVAIGLADAGGLESLSMRRIAQELGVEAMSLYYHVKSKDGSIDGIADAVINEIAPPSPEDGWKLALRKRAGSARAVLARHPWAVALMRNTPRLQR